MVVAIDTSARPDGADEADSGPGLSHRIAKSIVEGMGGRLAQRVSGMGGDRIEVILPKFRARGAA
jgi:hypothetical protein